MANLPISGLPPAAVASLTDELPVNDLGITKKVTAQQIVDLVGPGTDEGPIIRSVGDFVVATSNPNNPFVDIAPGVVASYRMTDQDREVYDGVILPNGIDQTQPLKVSIIWFPFLAGAGNVHIEFSFTKTAIPGVPSGGVSQHTFIQNTNSTAFQLLETATFDIATPVHGESLNFRVRYFNGSSTYSGDIGLCYVKLAPTYL